MADLVLRNVHPDVLARLERMGSRRGMTAAEFAIHELSSAFAQVDNAALLGSLPSQDFDPATIVADIRAARDSR